MTQKQRQQGGVNGEATDEAVGWLDEVGGPARAEASEAGAAPRIDDLFGPKYSGIAARRELRDSVYRLLRYAVSEAMVSIDSHWVSRVAPILSKDEQHLDAGDERMLWLAYHALSRAIAPASNESLKLKERIDHESWRYALGQKRQDTTLARLYRHSFLNYKVLLWGIGILFLILQGYALFLSNTLHGIEKQRDLLLQINQQIVAVRQAGPDLPETKAPLSELVQQRNWGRLKMKADYAALHSLSFPWGMLYPAIDVELDRMSRADGGPEHVLHSQVDASIPHHLSVFR
jgi:hypothetical protein